MLTHYVFKTYLFRHNVQLNVHQLPLGSTYSNNHFIVSAAQFKALNVLQLTMVHSVYQTEKHQTCQRFQEVVLNKVSFK